jgi:chemotaxis protein methyltransferase CheR
MVQRLEYHELALWIQFIFDLTGIALSEEKEYLIRERLTSLLQRYRCNTFSHLYFLAREPGQRKLRDEIIDQITIKETSFFRDSSPFDALKSKILPELLNRVRSFPQPRALKIWSAACATGQEAYSIAMILKDLGAAPKEYQITATDISHQALLAAKTGSYSKFEVERGVPPDFLKKYFIARSEQYHIHDSLKESMIFDRIELQKPFLLPERYDLIFCRNVAIYFSARDRESLFVKIRRHLNDDGYLLIGSTESTRDLPPLFKETRIDERTVFLKPSGKSMFVE